MPKCLQSASRSITETLRNTENTEFFVNFTQENINSLCPL